MIRSPEPLAIAAMEPRALADFLAARKDGAGQPAALPGGLGAGVREGMSYAVHGNVAVVPVQGVLMKRPEWLDALFGARSTELIARGIAAALGDPDVTSILLDVDSPGGAVSGTQELAQAVYAAKARKPVVTLASGAMASAAYWIGSAADSVWISGDTVALGSIGILARHYDISARERALGIKTTEITAGRYKAISSEHAPLSPEGRGALQAQVDALYTAFVDDVARFRGTSSTAVLDRMADGRIFIGRQAIGAGLADGVASFNELLGELSAGTLGRRRPAAPAIAASASGFALAFAELFERAATSAAAPTGPRTIEERCRARWDADPELRGEFGGVFNAYLALERLVAEGRVHERSKRNG